MQSSGLARSFWRTEIASLISSIRCSLISAGGVLEMIRRLPLPARQSVASIFSVIGHVAAFAALIIFFLNNPIQRSVSSNKFNT